MFSCNILNYKVTIKSFISYKCCLCRRNGQNNWKANKQKKDQNRQIHHVYNKKKQQKKPDVDIRHKVWDTIFIKCFTQQHEKSQSSHEKLIDTTLIPLKITPHSAKTPLKMHHTDTRGVTETTKKCKTPHKYHW